MNRSFQSSSLASRVAATVLLAAALAPAGAEEPLPATTSAESSGMSSLEAAHTPIVRDENGVSYVTGGVSIEGRAQLAPLSRGMNLQLVFAEKGSGAYLADVDVQIKDAGGRDVLNVKGSEPLVFAQLQPGTYAVTATVDGQAIERQVKVPSSGQRTELFQWG